MDEVWWWRCGGRSAGNDENYAIVVDNNNVANDDNDDQIYNEAHPPHLRLRAMRADLSRSRPREANSSAELKADRSR